MIDDLKVRNLISQVLKKSIIPTHLKKDYLDILQKDADYQVVIGLKGKETHGILTNVLITHGKFQYCVVPNSNAFALVDRTDENT